jgi:hypothetical protein
MGGGVVDIVTHPKRTIEGAFNAVTHPIETTEAIAAGVWNTGKAVVFGDTKARARAITELTSTWLTGKVIVAGVTRNVGGSAIKPGGLRSLGGTTWESAAGLRYGPGSAQGNRVRHVLEHAADIPTRAGAHGVFSGGRSRVLETIDEAYVLARAGGAGVSVVQQGARTTYTVDMGRTIGFVGGRAGAALGNPGASHVRLVLEGSNVITAFPVIP